MRARSIETALARFTLACLVVYVPVETWTAWPHGLDHPMYLVDVVAMILLAFGAWHSLRARPSTAPGPLAVGWAWATANGWRATSWRWLETRDGGVLEHGTLELWATGVATLVGLVCLAIGLWLSARREP